MNPAPLISAVVCTHNPRADYLNRVLEALSAQTMPHDQTELLIVDSGSTPPLAQRTDLQIPAEVRIIRMEQPGLAIARRAGAEAATGELIASVDDDTVFEAGYLQAAVDFMRNNSSVGSCGGSFDPEFESTPPQWFNGFEKLLAVRHLGNEVIVVPAPSVENKLPEFPDAAPIGVNVARRSVYENYFHRWASEPAHACLGRTGATLTSGDDNDFSLCCLEAGWSLAYVPSLQSKHLIPATRLHPDYLAKLNRASARSWIKVLMLHQLCPWPPVARWTVRLRQIKAWFTRRAWAGPAEYIRWQGACGHFEGRAKS